MSSHEIMKMNTEIWSNFNELNKAMAWQYLLNMVLIVWLTATSIYVFSRK